MPRWCLSRSTWIEWIDYSGGMPCVAKPHDVGVVDGTVFDGAALIVWITA